LDFFNPSLFSYFSPTHASILHVASCVQRSPPKYCPPLATILVSAEGPSSLPIPLCTDVPSQGVYSTSVRCWGGTRWRIWSRKVAGSIRYGAVGIFLLTQPFRPHYGHGVDSASNRNESQEYFLWGKDDRCVRLTTLPPSCVEYLEIWGASTSWNAQGLSWPVLLFSALLNTCQLTRYGNFMALLLCCDTV